MNIANKIAFLVSILLIGMAVNNIVGLHQIAAVKGELYSVTQRDMLLTEAITDLHLKQLKKGILFERLLRIAEELGFEDVPPARRIYLMDQLKVTRKGFDKLAKEGALAIISAKKILKEAMRKPSKFIPQEDVRKASERLANIEEAHIRYDKNVQTLLTQIQKEKVEVSFAELSRTGSDERKLTLAVEDLLAQVRGFTRISLSAAQEAQNIARKILLYSLYISIFLGALLALWIIRGIALPLNRLVVATQKIGAGDLSARIGEISRDEIGHLSEAFNLMAEQLAAAKKELEEKNTALAESLELTHRQKKDLEKVNRELDGFVATLSHDIRAPLTGITGYGTVLQKEYYAKLDKRGQRSIDGIRKGAERMNAMLHDLLELTKISRAKNPYTKVDINDVVDEVCDRLEYKIEQNGAEVKVADELPVVRCDKIKMGVVFFNLLNNAIKFSSGGSEAPQIEIGYIKEGDVHRFFVKDNGVGIAPEDQEKIFEMFQRAETAQKYEGTGAGLSFVREIVREHKGTIWVESEPGRGACFYFTISGQLT